MVCKINECTNNIIAQGMCFNHWRRKNRGWSDERLANTPLLDNTVKNHPLYQTWNSMKNRCRAKNVRGYKHYGGRGIGVCNRWLEAGGVGFRNFCKDMGERPPGHTLDRIDVNGNYTPDNCRWADLETQSRNKRGLNEVPGVGIMKKTGKWRCYKSISGRFVSKTFNTKEEAIAHLPYLKLPR